MKANLSPNWERVKLGNVSVINKSTLPSTTNKDRSFYYIDLSSVNEGVLSSALKKITFENSPSRARRIISRGDVLLAGVRPNLLGHLFIDFNSDEYIGSTGFIVITPEPKFLDGGFIYSYFFSKPFSDYIKNITVGSSYPAVNSSDIEGLQFLLPPLPEQNRIVAVLETWDKVIELLKKKIELKKEVKKGLMHELLTGKIRLPRFKEMWELTKFGDLFSERSERGKMGLKLLSITSNRGVIYQTDSNKKDTSNSDKSKYLRICPGDIGYNTMRMWQGRSALSKLEGLVSPAYTILIPGKMTDSRYFAHLFQMPRIIDYFFQKSQGLVSDTWQCRFKDFSIVKYLVPKLEEQKAIADILELADNEIKSLNSKLEYLQDQKKYLLNNLISGNIRTPENLTIFS